MTPHDSQPDQRHQSLSDCIHDLKLIAGLGTIREWSSVRSMVCLLEAG
ncbi:MAG: hypothetical protein R3C56_00360 [Pirellulaceae bacterium]